MLLASITWPKSLASYDGDPFSGETFESACFNGQAVHSGLLAGKCIDSVGIGFRLVALVCVSIRQRHMRAGDSGSGGIQHYTGQFTASDLPVARGRTA
jgi:hypothetical protein